MSWIAFAPVDGWDVRACCIMFVNIISTFISLSWLCRMIVDSGVLRILLKKLSITFSLNRIFLYKINEQGFVRKITSPFLTSGRHWPMWVQECVHRTLTRGTTGDATNALLSCRSRVRQTSKTQALNYVTDQQGIYGQG
jgi:hypothetical protein